MNKEKIVRYLDGFKKAFSAMTVTLILIALATVSFVCFTDMDGGYIGTQKAVSEWGNLAGCVFACTACGAFFAENAIGNKPVRYGVIALSFVFSTLYMLENKLRWIDFTAAFRGGYYWCPLAAYAVFMLTAGFYACFRKSHLTFRNYATGLLMNGILWSVVSGVLESGVLTLVLIFSILIKESEDLILKAIMLVSGLIVLPGTLLLLRNVQKPDGKFIKALLSYVTFPLVLIAFLIVYIYMAKIFITSEVPSNMVFAILAGIFCVAAPLITMTEAVNDSRFYQKATRILYWLFIPFILIECYALGVRLNTYGMTPKRFIGILIIVLEIVYLVLSLTKKKKQEWILPVFACLAVMALAVPGVNMFSISKGLQTRTLKSFQAHPTAEKAVRASAAYSYLNDLPGEFKSVVYEMNGAEKDKLYALIEEKLEGKAPEQLVEDGTDWFYFDPFTAGNGVIPTDGFSGVQVGEIHWNFSDPDYFDYRELQQIDIVNDRGEIITTADLSGFIRDYLEYAEENYEKGLTVQDGYDEAFRKMEVNDELTVYILHMSVSGCREGNEYIPDNVNAEVLVFSR